MPFQFHLIFSLRTSNSCAALKNEEGGRSPSPESPPFFTFSNSETLHDQFKTRPARPRSDHRRLRSREENSTHRPAAGGRKNCRCPKPGRNHQGIFPGKRERTTLV